MPVRTTATFNQPLTTYAQGIAQDRLAAYRLANLLCPIVQVGAASGTFKKFDDRNSFLVEDDKRPIGGPARRLQFEASDGTYNCEPHALEIGRDDFEADLVSAQVANTEVGMALLDQGKIKSLVSRKATGYAARVVSFVAANLTGVANRGNFSNNDIDPIDQIDEQLNALATLVSSTENISVVMGLAVWTALRRNAQVKKRLGLQPAISLTREMLTGGLLFPVTLEVSAVSQLTSKFGQSGDFAQSKTQLLNSYVIILYSVPSPTPMDASAFKCFSTSSVLVDAVRTYRDESSRSDIHAVDWSETLKATGTACAILLNVT